MTDRVVENLERAADRAYEDGDEDRARRLQDAANERRAKLNRRLIAEGGQI